MSLKDTLLSQLKPAVIKQLKDEIATGKLDVSKKYDFESNFDRIFAVLVNNELMNTAMKAFKVTKEDLQQLVKECLTEVGVQL